MYLRIWTTVEVLQRTKLFRDDSLSSIQFPPLDLKVLEHAGSRSPTIILACLVLFW